MEKWFLWQHQICQSSKRGRALKDVFPDFQLGDLPRIVFNPAEREREAREAGEITQPTKQQSRIWILDPSRFQGIVILLARFNACTI